MTRRTVVILQHRLLHYRVQLFERLRQACADRGIDLELVHGQASPREVAKRDEGRLPWAHAVHNRFLAFGERDLLWQPLPATLQTADLLVVMQENRIVSNYLRMLSCRLRGRRVAYWGHGKNFQSEAPDGLREQWKNLLLRQVDWWFTYTDLSVSVIQAAGYPVARITSLENAIDTTGFLADLHSCRDEEVVQARSALGIPVQASVGLFCGSLYPEKKLSLMVDAACRIQRRLPQFHLLVIGDGPSMPELQAAAAQHPWIHILGIRKGREKALHFRMAQIMFNPGLVGLHIVDAFCAGLVIATTATALHSPEIAYLRPDDNGILADSDNPEVYAQAVLDVLMAPDRLAAMRTASLRDSGRYTLDNMVQRFVNGIEQALAAAPLGSSR
jgi:L-malate glycosyltransferase